MQAYIVIGANYGDEGKGKVTALLCKDQPKKTLNILTNGGSQRGHTVEDDFELCGGKHVRHIFHHFGSGTLYGVDNYFSENFIINPITFRQEYEQILSYGFNLEQITLYCENSCRYSTPWDMLANQIIETARDKNRHGSCGYGIWETVLRYRKESFIDIFALHNLPRPEQVRELQHIRAHLEQRILNEIEEIPETWRDFWRTYWGSDELLNQYIEDVDFFVTHVVQCHGCPRTYDILVLENGQGLLLDGDPKNVHTTPSITRSAPALNALITQNLGITDIHLTYVTRTYITRHGAGPFPEEAEMHLQKDQTNIDNEWQGGLRYGILPLDALKTRIRHDINETSSIPNVCNIDASLYITHLDELNNFSEFRQMFADTNIALIEC